MNENINLCEMLKDCPEGTLLYSTVYGEVKFKGIDYNAKEYPIDTYDCDDGEWVFTKEGKYFDEGDAECVLFPSKDQRDWSKFKAPWLEKPKFGPKTLQPFDKVLARDANDREWIALLFSQINTKGKVIVAGCAWAQVIPYNEDTKHLAGTSDEAPEYYRYWRIEYEDWKITSKDTFLPQEYEDTRQQVMGNHSYEYR